MGPDPDVHSPASSLARGFNKMEAGDQLLQFQLGQGSRAPRLLSKKAGRQHKMSMSDASSSAWFNQQQTPATLVAKARRRPNIAFASTSVSSGMPASSAQSELGKLITCGIGLSSLAFWAPGYLCSTCKGRSHRTARAQC